MLGIIEGESSFFLDRSKFQPTFSLALTKIQLPVLVKIKEYLENNLEFDKYSKFKLLNSSAISIMGSKAINNSKPMARFAILNTNILNNYFIPFLEKMTFITKKVKISVI